MLKFAAIGVIKVPQYPAVIPSDATTAGFAPFAINNGTPIPRVITVNAANALPIIIVNTTIPTIYATAAANTPASPTIPAAKLPISFPTPADANITPKPPNNCGSNDEDPTCINIFVVSSAVSFAFGFAIIIAIIKANNDEIVRTCAADNENIPSVFFKGILKDFNCDKSIALIPITKAGIKILPPTFSAFFILSSSVSSLNSAGLI